MLTIKPILKRASEKTNDKNNISYIRYILRRIRYNNYTPILSECQIKMRKIFNFILRGFLPKTAYFNKIMHIFQKIFGFLIF